MLLLRVSGRGPCRPADLLPFDWDITSLSSCGSLFTGRFFKGPSGLFAILVFPAAQISMQLLFHADAHLFFL